jgi:transposase
VDGLGNPTHVHLTPGNVHDVVEAGRLVDAARGKHFVADKAYDSAAVVEAIERKGMTAVIPSRSCRKQARTIDKHLYKERHLIECFFARLKQFRRVATRYEKTATNFLGFVLIASIKIWFA